MARHSEGLGSRCNRDDSTDEYADRKGEQHACKVVSVSHEGR